MDLMARRSGALFAAVCSGFVALRALVAAVHQDYGNRSSFETLFTECLLNQEGIPISDRIFFDTYAECNKNLIIINFKQVK